MPHILKRPSWYLPESAATDQSIYQNRRTFLAKMANAGLIATLGISGCDAKQATAQTNLSLADQPKTSPLPPITLPPFTLNPKYADAGRPITDEKQATTYTNFYEFAYDKSGAERVAASFSIDPYTLVVDGLVRNPLKLSLDEVMAFGLEERVYRFRCVEAWAMTVPWLGFPLSTLLKMADVKAEGKFVAFQSFNDPSAAPNLSNRSLPWPYIEGLSIAEAMNELTFVSVGLYGKALQPQNGTPLRMVIPWKYGFKGGKSIVKITVMAKQPKTFWNTMSPHEYKFEANVEPHIPHPRWSQAKEERLGIPEGKIFPTELYNGYGEEVATLYQG